MSDFISSTRTAVSTTVPAAAKLNLNMEPQKFSNWCWAAVSVSVSQFLDSNSSWEQCKLVNKAFGQSSCCTNGGSPICNKTNLLESALSITENLNPASPIQGAVNFDRIQDEIANRRCPVGVRVEWPNSGGMGHFLTIVGYDSATQSVSVKDPIYGTKTYTLAAFSTNYNQAGGRWSHTYMTKRSSE